MSKKTSTFPVVDPHGNCFEGTEAKGAFHVEGRGVFIRAMGGGFLHFIEEPDDERAKHIRDEVVNVIVQLSEGVAYEPRWPGKKTAAGPGSAKREAGSPG